MPRCRCSRSPRPTRPTRSSSPEVGEVAERRPNRVQGPEHDQFWAYCAGGELRIQRCDACGHLSWPPTSLCEHCGSGRLTWAPMTGVGRVVSWCTFERRYYAELDVPWDTIL